MKWALLLSLLAHGVAAAEFPPFLVTSSVKTVEQVDDGYRVVHVDGRSERWFRYGDELRGERGLVYLPTAKGWKLKERPVEFIREPDGWRVQSLSGGFIWTDGTSMRLGTNRFSIFGNWLRRDT